MNISVQTLLKKIEQELKSAQNTSSEGKIRERMHTIKSLCEVILDEKESTTLSNRPVVTASPSIAPQSIQPTSIQTKPLKMDDDSNGESLFDF